MDVLPMRHSNSVTEKGKNGYLINYHVEADLDHPAHLMRHVYEHLDKFTLLGQRASTVTHRNWTWKHAAIKLATILGLPSVMPALFLSMAYQKRD